MTDFDTDMLTFVEKEFYTTPPEKDAPPEAWEEWMKKEAHKRRGHKAAFTRATAHLQEAGEAPEMVSRKVNGVWRQVAPVGFTGSAEDGTTQVEAQIDALQDKVHILSQWADGKPKRGTKSKSRHARRRRNKKKKRK